MSKHASALAASVLLLLTAPAATAVPAYQVTQLSPQSVTRWTHLNNAGAATGYLDGAGWVRSANGQLARIAPLSGETAAITAFGDNSAVGLARYEQGPPQGVLETGLWRNGVIEPLAHLRTIDDGRGYGLVTNISNNGLLAGHSTVDAGYYDEYGVFVPYLHAATFANGQVRDLGTLGGTYSASTGINDSGTVVGISTDSAGAYGSFIYRNGRMDDLGLPERYRANGINNAGQVIANRSDAEFNAILWQGGHTVDLTLPGYSFSTAYGINNRGDVVGRLFNRTELGKGFVYADGEMHMLSALIEEPGWNIDEIVGINDTRTILAGGCRNGECSWLLLTPVPEPALWALLTAGVPFILWTARRRNAA